MLGKPMTQQQAEAIKKILTGESKGAKPTRNGRAKKTTVKRKAATKEENEMYYILVAAAFLFFCGYFYYKTGHLPF